MIRSSLLLAVLCVALWQPQCAASAATAGFLEEPQDTAVQAYPLPSDKRVSIVIMSPDAEVTELRDEGPAMTNEAWTATARQQLEKALRADLRGRRVPVSTMDEQVANYRARIEAQSRHALCQPAGDRSAQPGPPPVPALPTCDPIDTPAMADPTARVADYADLHRELVEAILAERYGEGEGLLPARHGAFAFTLGSGAQELAEVSGATYALFVISNDQFAGAGGRESAATGRMGCILGLCAGAHGRHVAYASLVELATGNVVWFNEERGTKADVREEAGAHALVQALLARMPTRPGETMPPPARKGLW